MVDGLVLASPVLLPVDRFGEYGASAFFGCRRCAVELNSQVARDREPEVGRVLKGLLGLHELLEAFKGGLLDLGREPVLYVVGIEVLDHPRLGS